jgi:hypothetical protein
MEVSGQLHARDALAPGERAPSIHWVRGWVGPTAGLYTVEKRKILHWQESNLKCPAHSLSLLTPFLLSVKKVLS